MAHVPDARRGWGRKALQAGLLAVWMALGGTAFPQRQVNPPAAETVAPNLPAQKIGPNDLIALSVYGAPEFNRTIRVTADGEIRLPMLKQSIHAAGRRPNELETVIASALSAEDILVDPSVTVTVVEYQSRPISVAGAVKSPITFQAAGSLTLLEAINRAGGLAPEAGGVIIVSRANAGADGSEGASTRQIPVKSLIGGANPESNLKLLGGEEIRVPEAGKVFVLGNIKKPGCYPMQEDSETTVLKMVAVSEGLLPYASHEAYIIRVDEHTGLKKEIPVELQKLMHRKAPDVTLAANDILYIPDNTGRRATMTALDKITGFGASTASGVIIWGGR